MPKKLKSFFILLAAICLFLLVSYVTYVKLTSGPPLHVAESYVCALASGDTKTALQLSSGSAAWSASRLKGSGVTAKVERADCSVAALGRGWAGVLAAVELTLKDGSADMGWYSLDLTKEGRDWKVVSFREAEPEISGVSLFVKRADAEAAEEVFRRYLDALAAGDWQGAAKYLAGPARRKQEMSAAVLGKGAVVSDIKDLESKAAWESGRRLLVSHAYKVSDREVSVTVFYFKTKQGWKIVKVTQN